MTDQVMKIGYFMYPYLFLAIFEGILLMPDVLWFQYVGRSLAWTAKRAPRRITLQKLS